MSDRGGSHDWTLPDLVRHERLERGWSVRKAAAATAGDNDISNTYWTRFEDGHIPLSPRITAAIADAFDWPGDWPARNTAGPGGARDDTLAHVEATLQVVQARLDQLERERRVGPPPPPTSER